MDANAFAHKYDFVQLGDRDCIVFNLKQIGEMLRNHTLDEIPDIVEEMCNVK